MARIKNRFFIVAQNPDGRVKAPVVVECATEEEVQDTIIKRELDTETLNVFAGQHLPVQRQVRILLGEPKKRRGRPPGSKNKVKRAARGKVAAKRAGARVKAKLKGKKSAISAAPVAAPAPVAARVKNGRKKESQAERNARVEAAG